MSSTPSTTPTPTHPPTIRRRSGSGNPAQYIYWVLGFIAALFLIGLIKSIKTTKKDVQETEQPQQQVVVREIKPVKTYYDFATHPDGVKVYLCRGNGVWTDLPKINKSGIGTPKVALYYDNGAFIGYDWGGVVTDWGNISDGWYIFRTVTDDNELDPGEVPATGIEIEVYPCD